MFRRGHSWGGKEAEGGVEGATASVGFQLEHVSLMSTSIYLLGICILYYCKTSNVRSKIKPDFFAICPAFLWSGNIFYL